MPHGFKMFSFGSVIMLTDAPVHMFVEFLVTRSIYKPTLYIKNLIDILKSMDKPG